MRENFNSSKSIHAGRNVKRLREVLGIKQEALAIVLGPEWNQQRISLLEKRKEINIGILEQIADALNVPIGVIIQVDDENLLDIITNNLKSIHKLSSDSFKKWLNVLEENNRLMYKVLKAKDRLIKDLLISIQEK